MDNVGHLSTCGFLCRREEELSAPRVSLFWMPSSFGVVCVGFCLVWVLGFAVCFHL